ncbi:MAG: outer membrane beta-barrel protein [Pseudomonadota bacterium]
MAEPAPPLADWNKTTTTRDDGSHRPGAPSPLDLEPPPGRLGTDNGRAPLLNAPDATGRTSHARTAPARSDARRPEDREAFALPSAGVDRQAFDIEVSPVLSERPRQLFRFQPYEPTGIRVGSFTILPEVEFAAFVDSNVLQESSARSDEAIEVLPSVRIVSNWRVHALEVRASGAATRFHQLSSEDEDNYDIAIRGRIDVRRRTNIEAMVSRSVSTESRSDLDAGPAGTERADVTTDTVAVTLNQRFNRLALQLRGAVVDERVSDTSDPTTGLISNADRDEREDEVAVRATWEFKPALFVFAEAAINWRTYGAPAASDGLRRDSQGERLRTGLSFGSTGQFLRGEISIGFGRQRPDDSRLASIDGILVDANLTWRINGLTSASFNATTDFEGTTIAGSSGSKRHLVGLGVRHAFRRNVITTAGVSYEVTEFEGADIREREFTATVALEYLLNRYAAMLGSYEFIDYRTSEDDPGYNDHKLRFGMRFRR